MYSSQKSVYSNQLFSKQVLSESISVLVISFVRNSSLSEVSISCLQLDRNRVRGIRSVLFSSAVALKLAVLDRLYETEALCSLEVTVNPQTNNRAFGCLWV